MWEEILGHPVYHYIEDEQQSTTVKEVATQSTNEDSSYPPAIMADDAESSSSIVSSSKTTTSKHGNSSKELPSSSSKASKGSSSKLVQERNLQEVMNTTSPAETYYPTLVPTKAPVVGGNNVEDDTMPPVENMPPVANVNTQSPTAMVVVDTPAPVAIVDNDTPSPTATMANGNGEGCPANEPFVEFGLVIQISYKLVSGAVDYSVEDILSTPFSIQIYRDEYRLDFLMKNDNGEPFVGQLADLTCTTELLIGTKLTALPSPQPIVDDTYIPTESPTLSPILGTQDPTVMPTLSPSVIDPTVMPTLSPTIVTETPTTEMPTTEMPTTETEMPTTATEMPTTCMFL